MHWLTIFFDLEAKFGSLEKKDKIRLTSIEMKFFRRSAGYTLFDHKRNEEILKQLKEEPVHEETKKIQIQFATTRNKNEHQQDGKNNAELQTEWMKATWKICEETIRRGRNRSIKA
jgi:hypothetical protein